MKLNKEQVVKALEEMIEVLQIKKNSTDKTLLQVSMDDPMEDHTDLILKVTPLIILDEDFLSGATWKVIKVLDPDFYEKIKDEIPSKPTEDFVDSEPEPKPEEVEEVEEGPPVEEKKVNKKKEKVKEEPRTEIIAEVKEEQIIDESVGSGLKINETFRAACPKLTDDERKALEKLILKDGKIIEPILYWGKTLEIVDGHHRYDIARKYNMIYPVKEMQFENETAVIVWIKENAISQRNLSDFSKYELIKDLELLLKGAGKKKQAEKGKKDSDVTHTTREDIAKKVGISPRQIAKAKAIDKIADEETKEALRKDEVKIGKVYEEVKSKSKKKDSTQNNMIQVSNAIRGLTLWNKKYGKHKILKDFVIAVDDVITNMEILKKAL